MNSHVLMISERFPPDIGGVARSAERTARQISRLGVKTHVLAWTKLLPPGQLETIEADGGVKLHRLGLFANQDFSLQHTMNVIEWLHGEHDYSALWGHYLYPAGFMAVMAAELLGVASTVSARGNDVDRVMFPPGDFARLTWTLERANAVTSVSHDLARKINVLLGDERSQPIHVLHNSVDSEAFSAAEPEQQQSLRQSLQIAPPEAILGFCGELRQKKGLPFLLNALAEVRRNRPACLLVIGEVRPREQTQLTAAMAEDPDIGDRVIVTGRIDDPVQVARHLNLCDVFLQPSVWDGLPNAVLEAMACQRIVIGSDAGGIPEAIEHEKSGFIIPRAHLHRLGEAVLDVLSMPEADRVAMGQAARQRVVDHFNADLERERLDAVLSQIVR